MKAIIVGLGYVGLPLAQAACMAGVDVTGLDTNVATVDGLNSGRSHVDDLSSDDIAEMLEKGFRATTDVSALAEADIVIVCVPTPLDKSGRPNLDAVIGATESIASNISRGTTVVLESTTYPGTTEEILKPRLEQGGKVCGKDFFLAFSPERIDPGNKTYNIRNTPKVIGGVTEQCTENATAFYQHFAEQIVTARGTREAEMAKLLENTYRHINIALVNEMSQFCHLMGIDIWDVIRLAKTKPFGFQSFSPSAGVGGHCIPIDPNYLAYKIRADLDRPFRFVELAEEVNRSMPLFVSRRVQDMLNENYKSARGATVLILGAAYKADITDRRESPSVPLAQRFLNLGCTLQYHDPFVHDWEVDGKRVTEMHDLAQACRDADAVVVVQAHSAYLENPDAITKSGTLTLDATGKFDGDTIQRL